LNLRYLSRVPWLLVLCFVNGILSAFFRINASQMSKKILIVDLFAGPGGLGEGFSSFTCEGGRPFKLATSVEKDPKAHRTLTLRAFFRQFDQVPEEYYEYVRAGDPSLREELFRQFRSESDAAVEETLGGPRTLGDEEDDKQIFSRIRAALENHEGPKVVIGGPPCQAYSVVGRARNKGIEGYTLENDRRARLYREYLEVLNEVEPEVFVMENVRGILSAKVNGQLIFDQILKDLKKPFKSVGRTNGSEYEIFSLVSPLPQADVLDNRAYTSSSDFLIKAEKYGIPQTRHRVILLGVKRGLLIREPEILDPSPDICLTTADVIGDLPRLRSGLTKIENTPESWHGNLHDAAHAIRRMLEELNERLSLPDAFPLNGSGASLVSQGGNFVPFDAKIGEFAFPDESLRKWFLDDRIGGFLNHSARGHMPADIYRYLFASSFALLNDGASPTSRDFHPDLKPKHKNWTSGKFVDRFKVQARNRTPSTITSHIAKDGHYFIHYDPAQCRSLTVREAARIQTFPDNYFFEGNRTEQYAQVGNAVPPLLANKIAQIVHGILSSRQLTSKSETSHDLEHAVGEN